MVSMGFGRYMPDSPAAFIVATLQQYTGILINVLVFSVFVTKIQNPKVEWDCLKKKKIPHSDREMCNQIFSMFMYATS